MDHKMKLMELLHYSDTQITEQEEEDWKTVDEGENVRNSTNQNPIPEITVNIIEDEIPCIKEEKQWNNPTELELTQHEINNQINEQNYIKDLVIQSNEDLEAAEILQHHQCNAQAILLFQQANEKGLKALWLKRGDFRYKIHNEHFMTHKLEFLTYMVLTQQEREIKDDLEIVKQAQLLEEIGRSKGDFRPLCIRS